jgi:hypothetical protein
MKSAFWDVYTPQAVDWCMSRTRNTLKTQQRNTLLSREPGRRITVNTERLRSVAPYISLLCSPACSIAKGRAIVGSDIDYGLVVLDESIGQKQELAFVQELRDQGFNVEHADEITEPASHAEPAASTLEREIELAEYYFRVHDALRFTTETQMHVSFVETAQSCGSLTAMQSIYLTGFEIR